MMDSGMMHDMMGGEMMWAMGLMGLLVIVALVLLIAALIKYLLR
jgi:predicted RND superfamily exporter protein